jgi:hypothetical protein
MNTFLKQERTEASQKTAVFTGEGAYHGSSNKEPEKMPALGEKKRFPLFRAFFRNLCEVKKVLDIPSQKEIQEDGVTFVWATFEEAKREAGPLTKKVLLEMESHLRGDKKFTYVDSKIQFFHKGDLPVDSKLWHVDGTTAIRGDRAWQAGYTLLHDMTAKMKAGITDHYLAYQSSEHCATQWVVEGVELDLPECIPSFDELDQLVRLGDPIRISQPPSSIVHFTDNSLHRAVPASGDGWRLWIRVVETDKEVKLNSNIIECYGTVFKS